LLKALLCYQFFVDSTQLYPMTCVQDSDIYNCLVKYTKQKKTSSATSGLLCSSNKNGTVDRNNQCSFYIVIMQNNFSLYFNCADMLATQLFLLLIIFFSVYDSNKSSLLKPNLIEANFYRYFSFIFSNCTSELWMPQSYLHFII